MKAPRFIGWLRQHVVLTPQEKRAAACVVSAFLLGCFTLSYRNHHPRSVVSIPVKGARPAKNPTGFHRVSPTPAAPPEDAEEAMED